VPSCPAAGKPTYQYELSPNGKLFSVYCQGAHHSEAGQPPNHPSQSSEE
jgi:hypothetical protein